MRLLEAFNKSPLLSVVGSSTGRINRERLRAAIVARDQAVQALIEKRETLERLESVVRTSDDAAKKAADTAREAREARQRWVASGCSFSTARELQTFDDAAAAAAAVAQRAATDANEVSKVQALARAKSALDSAQFDIRGCEDAITGAIAVILAQEALPLIEALERAEAYRTARAKLMGVRLVLAQPWTLSNKDKMNPSWEGEQAITAALQRAFIESWDRERANPRARDSLDGTRNEEKWLDTLAQPWRARAEALRKDPDAV
jgi:hypothetical protein